MELPDIITTEVGVEIFSLTLNNKHRMEKEQMSTPDPVIPVRTPSMKPVATRTRLCLTRKLGMESKVGRFRCLKKERKRYF